MKRILLLIFLISFISYAQIPDTYYDSADGLTGYTLKTELHNIIDDHTDNYYSGLWITYQTSDLDVNYEGDGTILDIYSENPTDTDPYNFTYGTDQDTGSGSIEGDAYNREHIVPQSIFDEESPMRNDAHFVIPTDKIVNNRRSNYPHGNVASATVYTSENGTLVGTSADGYSGTVCEPIDEFKGDVARMYFYFATRYEDLIDEWYSYGMFDGSTDNVFADPFLDVLITWHNNDPVSDTEIKRNKALYIRQGNANPFIDHPEYVALIWSETVDDEAPTAITDLAASNITNTTVDLDWTASTDNVAVTSYNIYVDGSLYDTSSTNSATLTGLTQNTSYNITVYAKDAFGNTSTVSNTESITTTNIIDSESPTAITDLASSNITSSTVDLSWTASTDNVAISYYEIYQDGVQIDTSTTNSYNVSGLTAETTYDFVVYAVDTSGNVSSVSNTETITTSAATLDCGTETFTNATSLPSGGYGDGSFTGDNNVVWTYVESRDAGDDSGFEITGNGLMLRNTSSSLSASISGGIGNFTCSLLKAFTGSGNRQVELYINNVSQGTSIAWDNTDVQTFTVTDINIEGDVDIKIVPATGKQVTIDDISWTCYDDSELATDDYSITEFSVYPNPSKNNKVTIALNNTTEVNSVQFYNISGQLIIDKTQPVIINNKISIENIPSGIYFVKIQNDSSQSIKRLIVQ